MVLGLRLHYQSRDLSSIPAQGTRSHVRELDPLCHKEDPEQPNKQIHTFKKELKWMLDCAKTLRTTGM